jgi:hypothetical protein
MSIIQPSLSQQNIIDITDYVNSYRLKNQAAPLIWNDTIATFAQKWTKYMTSNHVFKHSGSTLYGENIAYFRGYGSDVMVLLKLAVDNWYNEISLYNFNKPGFSDATGHFTCLVWQASTMLGMGISINDATNEVYISFNTSPPGNIIGQFQQNVLPLSSNPTPLPTPITTPIPIPRPTPRPTPVPVPVPVPVVTPVPGYITNNKAHVISQLLRITNELNLNYPKNYIIQDIGKTINEIQNSSPF